MILKMSLRNEYPSISLDDPRENSYSTLDGSCSPADRLGPERDESDVYLEAHSSGWQPGSTVSNRIKHDYAPLLDPELFFNNLTYIKLLINNAALAHETALLHPEDYDAESQAGAAITAMQRQLDQLAGKFRSEMIACLLVSRNWKIGPTVTQSHV
jgi:hypothetical protein